ncbi:(d)CMP kinase [Candidatus Bandiella euplotis]|uniref:Cytidylate kinase n=1 Tax=Candidatus Bandiella euplotis TaxID=1664265 RepID=A0ABZ0UMF0_9RICK|nr:(d)CMP kinase [Candidatus Bandiella woodruffii]WPX96421.1 Cytidylate kinase [Candidatus Bandiella woodruffii]
MNNFPKTVIIAFDGTAASGKGTIAKLIAKELGYDYLDTGLMFRKVAYYCLKHNISFDDEQKICMLIDTIDFNKNVGEQELYANEISDAASKIAVQKQVREHLLMVQRNFANGKKGVVVDGRDIGTVVFPKADFKFFFDASLEQRTNRRYNQLQKKEKDAIFSQVLEQLKTRDQRDKERCIAPLKKAHDSFEIDTTDLSVQEVFDIVLKKVKQTN